MPDAQPRPASPRIEPVQASLSFVLAPQSLRARALQALTIAALYVATAKLGFLFALPPGNVTAVWLPSGIALAALLNARWAGAAGVWAGSFVVNALSLGHAGAALLVSGAIATGSTVQGALAAGLLLRFVLRGGEDQIVGPDPGRAALRSAAVLLPVSLVAASVGVGALVGGGFAPRDGAAELFVTWWLGDLAGILLVGAPLLAVRAVVAPAGGAALPGAVALAYCVAGAGVISWAVAAQLNRGAYDAQLQSEANLIAAQMSNELQAQVQYGRAVAALYARAEPVSAERFSQFGATLLRDAPAVGAVSFLARVPAARREAFEQSLRERGIAAQRIWERRADGVKVAAPARQEYVPVEHIFPLEANAAALGFDVSSEPNRAAALRRARAENTAISTSPLRLVQDPKAGKSLLIVQPVWRLATGENPAADRAESLIGYSSTVIRLRPLLERTLATRELGALQAGLLYRADRDAQAQFVAAGNADSPLTDAQDWLSGAHHESGYAFAGGFWSIVLRPPPGQAWSMPRIGATPWALLALFLGLGGAIILYAVAAHQQQTAVAESEQRFALIAENSSDYIFLLEESGKVLYDSASVRRMLGADYAGDRHVHLDSTYVHPDDRSKVREAFARVLRGEQTQLEHRWLLPSGEERWLDAVASRAGQGPNKRALVVVVARDVTDRRRLEMNLREMQKLEAIGQLTGGLAHDFNNLLGVVIGNLDEMGAQLPPDGALRKSHGAATQAALRGAEVTRSLLAVARRQPLKVQLQELNALVAEMLPLLRTSMGAGVTVRTQLWSADLPVRVDAAGLSNALLNLAINARDAMRDQPGAQRLALRTRYERILPGGDARLGAGEYAVLELEDSGPGMSAEVREKAFEPFFTTKDTGQGTGLGLSMVLGFAEQLGGTARIDSRPGAGTTVRLYLPLAARR